MCVLVFSECKYWNAAHLNFIIALTVILFNLIKKKLIKLDCNLTWLTKHHMRSGVLWRSPGLLCSRTPSAVPHSVDMFEKVNVDLLKYHFDMTKPVTSDWSFLHLENEDWAHDVALMAFSYLCTLSAPMFDRENHISLNSKLVEL